MKSKQTETVGLYLRLSNDDERSGESLSIENQRNILRKFVGEKDWKVYDEYIDEEIIYGEQ